MGIDAAGLPELLCFDLGVLNVLCQLAEDLLQEGPHFLARESFSLELHFFGVAQPLELPVQFC